MPVAMSLAAKSMGMTMDVFIKKVSEGKVQSKDFIRGYATELRSYVDETGALAASLDSVRTARNRFLTTFSLGVDLGFEEGKSGMKAFFQTLSKMVIDNLGAFRVLGESIGLFFKILTGGLEVIAPVLFFFTRSLDNIRMIFDNAFNLDKTIDKLSILEKMLRLVGGISMIAVGSLLIGFEELQKVLDGLLGNGSEGGLSLMQQVFAGMVAGSLLGWLSRVLGKFLGIKSAVALIAEATGKKGGKKPPSKTPSSSGGGIDATDVALTAAMAGGPWGKIIGGTIMAMDWVDRNSAGYNEMIWGKNMTSSQMAGDVYGNLTSALANNLESRRQSGFSAETKMVVNNSIYLRNDMTTEEAAQDLADKIKAAM